MSLSNLLKTNQLQMHEASALQIQQLLTAAKRNYKDASCLSISHENRFDAAYKCIMQCAMIGLWVKGYRTSTNQPGHHQVAIQTLSLTIALPQKDIIIFDALRKLRNVSDYEGDPIPESTVKECIKEAGRLLKTTEAWLKKHSS